MTEKRGTPGIVEGALTMSQSVSPLSFIAVTDRVLYIHRGNTAPLLSILILFHMLSHRDI